MSCGLECGRRGRLLYLHARTVALYCDAIVTESLQSCDNDGARFPPLVPRLDGTISHQSVTAKSHAQSNRGRGAMRHSHAALRDVVVTDHPSARRHGVRPDSACHAMRPQLLSGAAFESFQECYSGPKLLPDGLSGEHVQDVHQSTVRMESWRYSARDREHLAGICRTRNPKRWYSRRHLVEPHRRATYDTTSAGIDRRSLYLRRNSLEVP